MDIGSRAGSARGLPGRQSGLTIFGFLVVAAVAVVFAMVGFRVIPSYVEYFSVKKALDDAIRGNTADPNNPTAFRNELARRLETSYVENVKAADVILQRSGGQITAELAWERRLHMWGNMYILLEFEATSSR
jgi:hypothetical protein